MQAIINGLRYNTETATLIGEGSNGNDKGNFAWWEAGLYRTKSGRYFLAGKGGPMTQWAHRVDSGYTYGDGIIALEPADALAWAERELTTEEVEAGFPTITDA
jgi:hypothetical protein